MVKGLNCTNREGVKLLDDVSFTARSGEILGIAGIAGSGQRELLEAIAGLQKVRPGHDPLQQPQDERVENLRDKTPLQIRELGVRLSFVPEDRLGMGLVGNMDIVDNMMLRSYRAGPVGVPAAQGAQGPGQAHHRGAGGRHPRREHARAGACPAATCRRSWSGAKSPPRPRC